MEKIPLYVQIMAKMIPIPKWENQENLAKGEIEKFHLVESQKNKRRFGDQVVGCRDGYDLIWKHVSNDYFKLVGKAPERTC